MRILEQNLDAVFRVLSLKPTLAQVESTLRKKRSEPGLPPDQDQTAA